MARWLAEDMLALLEHENRLRKRQIYERASAVENNGSLKSMTIQVSTLWVLDLDLECVNTTA